MRLQEHELVKRYIYYLCRYISYDQQEIAKEDLLGILNRRLPPNFTDERLKKELNRLGNPYSFSEHYDTSKNFLLSGRNYDIFLALLKILLISAGLSFFIFILNYFNRIFRIPAIELIISYFVTISFMSLVPSWICEKIKRTKIMASLLKEWSADELYDRRKFRLKRELAIYITIYSALFMSLLIYIKSGDFPKSTHFLMGILFFLNILRDTLKISEKTMNNYVFYFALLVDILVPIILILMSKFLMPRITILVLVILLNLADLINMGIKTVQMKR